MIRVLIVDDSAFMRKALSLLLEGVADIQVIDTARDGMEAVEKVKALRPDLVTMDIEMPRMDGLTALRQIMKECPTPVMMVSSLTQEGAQATVEALQAGAVDFIPKQNSYVSLEIAQIKETLVEKIRTVARTRSRLFRRPARPASPSGGLPHTTATPAGSSPESSAPATVRPPTPPASVSLRAAHARLLVIGVSTGGPFALQKVLPALPADLPVPVAVVQHMPPHFTGPLADRLNALSPLTIVEATNGMAVRPGMVLIAPGGRHLTFRSGPQGLIAATPEEPTSMLHRPSVDVMFRSANEQLNGRVLAVVMTGMGKDGLLGCRDIKQRGGLVIAQDEDTSVVYGMPRAVVEAGLADAVLPLEQIAPVVTRALQRTAFARATP